MRLLISFIVVGSILMSIGACTSSSKSDANGQNHPDSGSGGTSAGGAGGTSTGGHPVFMHPGGMGGGGTGGMNSSDSGVSGGGPGGAGQGGNGGSMSIPDAGLGDAAADAAVCVDGDGGDGGSCDDGDACTINACVNGACVHTPINVDDGDGCTTDSCDPATGVISHSAVAIDDGNACTVDSCTPSTGVIHHLAGATCAANPSLTIADSGTPTISATMVVSGQGVKLRDLNVHTAITHTYSQDLSITLQSPAGTVVTLSSRNGNAVGGGVNVFNGTLWDDSANPGGTLPYTSNDGLVTDQAYVSGTVATPLAPEEPLGAFIGEDPNGTWTLTISDAANMDGGELASWGLDFTTSATMPAETNQTVTQSTPVAIADNSTVTSTLAVTTTTGSSICSVTVDTNITHTFPGDLSVTLTSPAGTVVTLTSNNGASNDDIFAGTEWRDDANPFGQIPYITNNGMVTDHAYAISVLANPLTPEEGLAAFIGESPDGTWTLTVNDDSTGDTGMLNSWAVNIGRCTP